jgi:large conductance mechanosensitive channel
MKNPIRRCNVWKEFKEFATRGNVLDLAIGIIIGGAFGKIVSSFVNDILMPPVGLMLGKVNFSDLFISLTGGTYKSLAEAKQAGAVTLNYGSFIQSIVDFLIIAFAIFLLVRSINRMKRGEEKAPLIKECPYCKSTINIQATRCPQCTSELKAA